MGVTLGVCLQDFWLQVYLDIRLKWNNMRHKQGFLMMNEDGLPIRISAWNDLMAGDNPPTM